MKHGLLLFLLLFQTVIYAQLNLQWHTLGPDNWGAPVRAMIIDQRDSSHQTLYAGVMGGGIWKSVNGADSWTYLGCLDNYGISCMCQALDGTIYFGTGDFIGNGSGLLPYRGGNGIYKLDTLDHAVHLSNTTSLLPNDNWFTVNAIAADPSDSQHLLATTEGGLWQTFDEGVTWTKITLPIGVGNFGCQGIKWSSDSVVYVTTNSRLIRSMNYGHSWAWINDVSNTGFPPSQGRMSIAFAPGASNITYISFATVTGATFGVYKTSNSGQTWDTVAHKNAGFDPFGVTLIGWANNAIEVLPNDFSKILVGAYSAYAITVPSVPVQLQTFTNAGIQPNGPLYVDGFLTDIANPDLIYAYGARGVFKCNNALSTYPNLVFDSRFSGMEAREFNTVAASAEGKIYGACHFTGLMVYTPAANQFIKKYQGNAHCAVSGLCSNYVFAGDYTGHLKTSVDSAQNFFYKQDTNLDPQNFGDPSRCGNFNSGNAPYLAAFILAETKRAFGNNDSVSYTASGNISAGDTFLVNSNISPYTFPAVSVNPVLQGSVIKIPDPVVSRLFMSSNCGIWMKRHALDTASSADWFRIASSFTGFASSFAATSDGNVLYAGTSAGEVVRVSGLHKIKNGMPWATEDSLVISTIFLSHSFRSIEGITVDPNNDSVVIAVLSEYPSVSSDSAVFITRDAGQTWNLLSIGMQNIPAYCCLVDRNNSNNFLIGTERGIWSSLDAGLTWVQENNAMCDVAVSDLKQTGLLSDECPVLYAATSSRGIWRSFSLTPAGCDISIGIAEQGAGAERALEIYPNPADNYITVKWKEAANSRYSLSIFDVSGRLVRFEKDLTDTQLVYTGDLSNGLYFAIAKSESKSVTSKFLLSH